MYKLFIAILFIVTANCVSAQAQTTAFNFQGRLNDGGNAANSNYDFRFKLFDSLAGGNQVSSTVDRANLQVINGVFSTVLDFGAGSFSASNRFLEISVRPAGSSNPHVILGARQQILAVPFAVQAVNAVASQTATSAATAENSLSLGGNLASSFARLNFDNQGDVRASLLRSSGNLSVDGNTVQPAAANGFIKAMLYVKPNVNANPTIVKCYNGVTNSSAGNCGFTVESATNLTGVYNINFGFNITTRFASVTAEYASGCDVFTTICGNFGHNYGANFRPNSANVLSVYTFAAGNSNDTVQAAFKIILY
jgi:hypothetical protein